MQLKLVNFDFISIKQIKNGFLKLVKTNVFSMEMGNNVTKQQY